ncbi:hypothetical protein [Nocardiopsis sp. MG754419]|uniref:hypothetical protein n=1 Tax=Nocardiopsis sp. MG754419 TaxID=2259865 RepID=UPI001BA96B2D|nr:hypothetical protein [Nocardiopsis sp. MG754419]MBR8745270.1 hypothetical protein [Nocardiopsis sp. MG754419]
MSGGVMAMLAIVVVVIVAITVMSAAAERKRVESLSAWARERGWHYDRERPELADRFGGAPFRRAPSNARAIHVLSAEHRGHRVLAYEYTYTTTSHNGQSTTTTRHRFPVVVVSTPHTPVLDVRTEHFGHALMGMLGVRDLQVGERLFDDTFRIRCEDEGFARAVLDEPVRAWLLERPEERVPFRFTGDHLVTWGQGALEPEAAVALADRLITLLELVPDGVWEGTRG